MKEKNKFFKRLVIFAIAITMCTTAFTAFAALSTSSEVEVNAGTDFLRMPISPLNRGSIPIPSNQGNIGTLGLSNALVAGADYLKHAQADITEDNAGNGYPDVPDDPDDGGWDWMLTSPAFTHSTAASATNCYGATAQGLYYAYLETSDSTYMTAMNDVATGMLNDPYVDSIDSAADLIWLMLYDDLVGSPGTWDNLAKSRYDTRIAGLVAPYTNDGKGLAEKIRDDRGVSYPNGIIAWDIGAFVKVAAMLDDRFGGYASDADDMAEVLYQDSFNDAPGYFDIIDDQGYDPTYGDVNFWWYPHGITGLIDAFDAAQVHTSEIPGLLTILLNCKCASGAFSFQYGGNTGDEDWQSSAYAVMTLAQYDQATYQQDINDVFCWIAATQDPASGGWVYGSGNHYPEVGGENTAALYFANGPVKNIDTGEIFCTIQGAIDDSDTLPGHTIDVSAGTYKEYIHIVKDDLTIQGAGIDQSIIDLDGLLPYWHYTGGSYASRGGVLITPYGQAAAGGNMVGGDSELIEDVTFEGFTVKNAGLNPPVPYPEFNDPDGDGQDDVVGIRVGSGKDISILNCKVENGGDYGIAGGRARMTDAGTRPPSEDLTIDSCTILHNSDNGISIGDTTGATGITITNNIVMDNIHPTVPGLHHEKGIQVSGRSNTQPLGGIISGNTVSGNAYHGINLYRYTNGITVEDNIVTGHNLNSEGCGIFMGSASPSRDCKNHIIRNNIVTGNIRGIIAYYVCSDSIIEGNTVTTDSGTFPTGQAAIKIDNSYNIEVKDNSISCDGVGIELLQSGTYDNTFTGNTVDGAMFAGIYIRSGAHDNTFTGNTIKNTVSDTFTQWADWGTHGGSSNAATLSDSTKSWTTDAFVGMTVINDDDGSEGTITANTATTVTATLSGGTENDWDNGDAYDIVYEETQADGVFLRGGNCYAGGHAGIDNVFHCNDIYNNADDGMENQITTQVNAECNWWGVCDDPSSYIVGNVDFDPWLGLVIADAGGPYNIPEDTFTVHFDGSGTVSSGCCGETVSIEWDFGDGDTGTGVSPTHTYKSADHHAVTLTVTTVTLGYTCIDTDTTYAGSDLPFIYLQYPTGGETLKDTIDIEWTAHDTEDGTNLPIYLYLFDSDDDMTPFPDNPYENTGSLSWDTTDFPDGEYKLLIEASDSDNNIGVDSCHFQIKNHEEPQNHAPNKPSKPIGKTNGKVGTSYSYSSSTTDPDGDQVWYKWDWGDEISGWLGPYNSSDAVTAEHTWDEKGDYNIKVKAKDMHGEESPWSDPLAISMPKNKVVNSFLPFLERLIGRFPILEQILQPIYDKLAGF